MLPSKRGIPYTTHNYVVGQSVLSLYLRILVGSTQPLGNHPFTCFRVLLWSVSHLKRYKGSLIFITVKLIMLTHHCLIHQTHRENGKDRWCFVTVPLVVETSYSNCCCRTSQASLQCLTRALFYCVLRYRFNTLQKEFLSSQSLAHDVMWQSTLVRCFSCKVFISYKA